MTLNEILISLPAKEAPRDDVKIPIVELHGVTEESYYTIAKWIMDAVSWLLSFVGLDDNNFVFTTVYAIVVFLISIGIGQVAKWIILFIVDHLSKIVRNDLYLRLRNSHFFSKFSRIIPAIVFLIFIQFTMTGKLTLSTWLSRITWIYIIYIVASSLNILAMVIWSHVDARENKKKLPLNGVVQLVKGIIWIIFAIVVVAILINKSPASLLAGLGAFAAVLMLVFKDSILGVVAGVQLSENDSLHVGDWIKVPGTDANGNVIEVTLTSVKVQNFDKTVTTLPPYSLVSGSFTNYRPMQITNTRRICRSYMIDGDSVLPCDEKMLDNFSKIPILTDWISKKREQKNAGKVEDVFNSEGLVDGSIDTNLGIFRAYVKLYLDQHPHVSHVSTDDCFVTTLAQTSVGIPLQVYCFTNTSKWLPYEAIQASIFEHIAIMMGRLNLYTYENASGRDEIVNGVLEAGANPELFFGLPYPFLSYGGTPAAPASPYPQNPKADITPDSPDPSPSRPSQTDNPSSSPNNTP